MNAAKASRATKATSRATKAGQPSTRITKTGPGKAAAGDAGGQPPYRYCALEPRPPLALPVDLSSDRMRALQVAHSMWADGTVVHYYFFDKKTDGQTMTMKDGTTRFFSWVGAEPQRTVVRDAFTTWKDIGIGLEFVEVDDRAEAEVRIGFLFDVDGSWSYIGRDVLQQGTNSRTMNFGWDLTANAYGMTTALHEIGHTLGMPHEHQSPFAGIEWNEAAVYSYFGGQPNNWPKTTTYNNVLRKLSTAEVSGSTWDPDSIMEYAFPPGLITAPAAYVAGVHPPGTISPVDSSYILTWYPEMAATLPTLQPFTSASLALAPAQQADFVLDPAGTRSYSIGSFGANDVVLVLFERVDGALRFVAGDDNSGLDRNALIRHRLFAGREYVVRLRCHYAAKSARTALMYW